MILTKKRLIHLLLRIIKGIVLSHILTLYIFTSSDNTSSADVIESTFLSLSNFRLRLFLSSYDILLQRHR